MNIVYIEPEVNFQSNKYCVDFVVRNKKGKLLGRQIITESLVEAENAITRLKWIKINRRKNVKR